MNTVTGNIKLSKIDFSYNKSDFYLNLSISINLQLFCISGSSGDGKLLFKILMGILEPSAGEVLVDGTNLNKLSVRVVEETSSLYSAKPKYFNSSIMDNILLGNDKLNEQVNRLLKLWTLNQKLKKPL